MNVYEGWLTLASHLRMPLRACMQSHTHREYKNLWLPYLDKQWNRPSRTDNYLMQVAVEIRRVLNLLCVYGSKKPADAVTLTQMILKFVQPKPQLKKTQAISKGGWLRAVGLRKKT